MSVGGGAKRRRVVYVSDGYPKLAQTFTTRDVRTLRAAGLLDLVVSLHERAPEDPAADPELDGPVVVLPLPFAPAVLVSALAWLVRRPVETLRLALVALAPYTTPFSVFWQVRAPLHVLWGMHLARVAPRPSHFHAQFVGAASTAAWVAARLSGGSFSMTAHQDWGLPLIRRKLEDAAFVIAISRKTREELLAFAPSAAPRIEIVRVGVDVPAISEPPRNAAFTLLAVGTVGPTKGHDVLLRAAALLRDRGVPFHLDLVGGGEGLPELEQLAARLGFRGDEPVKLHGAKPHAQVLELLRAADAVVLACRVTERGDRDGIPVALMEGMAAGKATVSTPVGAIGELIEDGVSGRLVPPDDPVALADALAGLAADPTLRRSLREGGRARILESFDARATARDLARTVGRALEMLPR